MEPRRSKKYLLENNMIFWWFLEALGSSTWTFCRLFWQPFLYHNSQNTSSKSCAKVCVGKAVKMCAKMHQKHSNIYAWIFEFRHLFTTCKTLKLIVKLQYARDIWGIEGVEMHEISLNNAQIKLDKYMKTWSQNHQKWPRNWCRNRPRGVQGDPNRPGDVQKASRGGQEAPVSIYLCFIVFLSDPSHPAECAWKP